MTNRIVSILATSILGVCLLVTGAAAGGKEGSPLSHFKAEDLFDYGMQPQFLSRFDNSIILEDLNAELLSKIFTDTDDSVFKISRHFFKTYEIDLEITDGAVRRIALEAAKSTRIGARALKSVWGRIIKPFEFDPYSQEQVKKDGDGYRLVIDESIVGQATSTAV